MWYHQGEDRQGMDTNIGDHTGIEELIGRRFAVLIQGLVEGNLHRASKIARATRKRAESAGRTLAVRNLVEEAAQAQAARNAVINLPSALPGPGTIMAWLLMVVEDFFTLDRIVLLVLTLAILEGHDPEDREGLERLAVAVTARTYGMEPGKTGGIASRMAGRLFSRLLPERYAKKAVNRWIRNLVRRLLRLRRKSRLLPAGIGVAIAAWDAYNLLVKAGEHALEEIAKPRTKTD